MKTEWIERKRDNLLRVEVGEVEVAEKVDGKIVRRMVPLVRDFAWGKDVSQEHAERESLLIVESEAD